MKRILSVIVVALLVGTMTFYLIDIFSSWYGPRYIKSDDDIGKAYVISLAILLASIVAGGIAGKVIYDKVRGAVESRGGQ